MDVDVIIIGGGVLGISLGYHLGQLGGKTIILEAEAVPAAHASGKNAGMIRQLYRNAQLTNWTKRSIALWPDEVHSQYFRQTGSMIVGRRVPAHHRELFQQVSFVSEGKTLPAVYTASDGLLDSSGYVNYLHGKTNRKSVETFFRQRVTAVRPLDHGWTVETENGGSYSGRQLVNAAGAWLNRFLEPHCPQLTVDAQAFARHLFVVQGWEENYMPAKDCGFFWEEENGWYLRQWDKTSRLVSVCDRVSADPDTFTPNASAAELAASKLLLSLPDQQTKNLAVSHSWYCFRTYTEDQLPVWGPDPIAPGLFWLSCFGGFGMSTSFAASYDAAQYLAGKNVAVVKEVTVSRLRQSRLGQIGVSAR